MNPSSAYINAIKQCCNYNGTASRLEYWMFLIAAWIIGFIFMLGGCIIFFGGMYFLDAVGMKENDIIITCIFGIYGFISFIFYLFCILLPFVSLTVRRLNDIGWSPWLALLYLIPGVTLIVMIVFGVVPSQSGR